MKPTICIFRSCRSVEEGDYIAGAQNASVSNVRHQHSSEIAGSPERLHHRFCLQKEETSPDSAGHPWSGMLSKQRCSDELTNQARSLTARYFQKLKIGSCKASGFRYYICLCLGPPKMQKKNWAFSSGGERFPDTEEVTSSNLVTPTIFQFDSDY